MTPQNLDSGEGPERATLIAYLLQRAAELTDEALEMHERIMAQTFSESENKRDQNFKERSKSINKKLGEYAGVGNALIAAREAGTRPLRGARNGAVLGMRFVESVAEAEDLALPAAFDSPGTCRGLLQQAPQVRAAPSGLFRLLGGPAGRASTRSGRGLQRPQRHRKA